MMEDEFSYLFKIILIGMVIQELARLTYSTDCKIRNFNMIQMRLIQQVYSTNNRSGIHKSNSEIRWEFGQVLNMGYSQVITMEYTAGQEKFRAITNAYYRGAKGVFVCYDVTKQGTYESTLRWMSEIKQFGDHDIVIMLVGNKIDLAEQRIVRTDEVSQFCEQNKVGYIETSALNNVNVELAFNQMVTEIYKIVSAQKPISQTLLGINDVYVLRKETQPEQTKQKKQCC